MVRRTRFVRTAVHLLIAALLGSGLTGRVAADDAIRVEAAGVEFEVFTYRPAHCERHDTLFVFHGLKRKARSLSRKAKAVADANCLAVFAPRFDKDRFPNWRYHRAGIYRRGEVQDQKRWTGPILSDLIATITRRFADPDARVYLFGHSAGAQFLSRIAAYSPPTTRVDRIVIANPSLHVRASLEEAVPNGFDGPWSEFERNSLLKAYLALPIAIYLGDQDTGTKYLVQTDAANRQGGNRLERGRSVYREAKDVASRRRWPFAWRLVEASGVGHSSRGMLESEALAKALGVASPEQRQQIQRGDGR